MSGAASAAWVTASLSSRLSLRRDAVLPGEPHEIVEQTAQLGELAGWISVDVDGSRLHMVAERASGGVWQRRPTPCRCLMF